MNKGESPKVYECVCGLKFPSSQYKASHCKVCAKYKEEARLGRVTQSPSVTPSATPSAMTSSSGSLGASCDSVDISLSPQDAAASLSPTPKSRTKSHGSTKREHTASPRSHLKLDRTLQQQQQQTQQGTSPLLSQLHQQQTVQQEYQRHPSLSEILKANVLTRGRTLERLDQDNYSDLHWSSRRECPLSLVPLADILYGGPDGAQQSTKGDELILDLESSTGAAAVASQAKKRRKVRASKYMASRSFLKALEESGVCGLPPNIPSWITATAPPPMRPRRYFCCICGRKGIYRCPTCGTRYCSLKCKGIHEAEKTKCKGLTSRTKT